MDIDLHLLFVSTLTERIAAASSKNSRSCLLSLSFTDRLPPARVVAGLRVGVDLAELSKGTHYAIIVSLFRDLPVQYPNRIELFSLVLSALRSLGFAPGPPCDPLNLANGIADDHANLCAALELLIVERALTPEQLFDDLRRIPRSFFVLRQFPSDIDASIVLWLNKFHCIAEIPEIADGVQAEAAKWIHVAAVLSRAFPTRIWKSAIRKSRDLSPPDVAANREAVVTLLSEFHAFVPPRLPIPDRLFRFFISEVYWVTRTGIRKFSAFDPFPFIATEKRPATVKVKVKVPRIDSKPRHKTVRTRKVDTGRAPVIDHAPEIESLFSIFRFMSKGDRRDKFFDVDEPLLLIDPLVGLMNGNETDQTFTNLAHILKEEAESELHLRNAVVFLTALSGNNNEFAASRKVIFFARKMMQSELPIFGPKAQNPKKPTLFVAVATQTASMTQNLMIVRDSFSRKTETRKARDSEFVTVGCQTDQISRTISDALLTLSYPYGAASSGFACPRRLVRRPMTSFNARMPSLDMG
jgi:hypothetical protein